MHVATSKMANNVINTNTSVTCNIGSYLHSCFVNLDIFKRSARACVLLLISLKQLSSCISWYILMSNKNSDISPVLSHFCHCNHFHTATCYLASSLFPSHLNIHQNHCRFCLRYSKYVILQDFLRIQTCCEM